MTEKQHSEHTGRARLLCILAMPPQARPHKTMAEAGKRKGPEGDPRNKRAFELVRIRPQRWPYLWGGKLIFWATNPHFDR